MAEQIWVRGEGGGIFQMSLPLSPYIQQRFDAGDLERVNEDGTPWTRTGAALAARKAKAAAKAEASGDGAG